MRKVPEAIPGLFLSMHQGYWIFGGPKSIIGGISGC